MKIDWDEIEWEEIEDQAVSNKQSLATNPFLEYLRRSPRILTAVTSPDIRDEYAMVLWVGDRVEKKMKKLGLEPCIKHPGFGEGLNDMCEIHEKPLGREAGDQKTIYDLVRKGEQALKDDSHFISLTTLHDVLTADKEEIIIRSDSVWYRFPTQDIMISCGMSRRLPIKRLKEFDENPGWDNYTHYCELGYLNKEGSFNRGEHMVEAFDD